MPVLILGGTPDPAGLLRVRVTATPPQAAALRVLVFAQAAEAPQVLRVRAEAYAPVPALSGAPLLTHDVQLHLTGLPPGADVLDWTYTHNGQHEELSVTVHGRHGMRLPSATLRVESLQVTAGAPVPFGDLPARTFTAAGAEPREDRAANTTTFLFRNSFDQALRGVRLPELIEWKLIPPPTPCLTNPRKRNISGLVREVITAYVTPDFRMEDDPLLNAFLEEGYTDFSTEGLTPQGVWDAFYGALGMVLHVRPGATGGLGLTGRWATPISNRAGAALPDDWRLASEEERQFMHIPTRLTVQAADGRKKLTDALLLEWVGANAARPEVERELAKNDTWVDGPFPSGFTQAYTAFRKEGGQITATAELTLSDLEVKETVAGVETSIIFPQVATAYRLTETTYDPVVKSRPLRERTVTTAWAFDLATKPGSGSFPLGLPGAPTGDLAADEETITNFFYSAQGWLSLKVIQTRRLGSLQQDGADLPPEERGPLQAREYVTTVQTEWWKPNRAGLWHHSPPVGDGQTFATVYDAETGDAIRTATVARAQPVPPRLTDEAPPSYPLYACEDDRWVTAPAGVSLTVDVGQGEEQTLSFPWLDPSYLTLLPGKLLASRWAWVETLLTIPFVRDHLPGAWITDGRVQEYTLKPAGDGGLTLDLKTVRLDTATFGQPVGLAEDVRTPSSGGRAIMLHQTPDGARVKFLRGWSAAGFNLLLEDGEVLFKSGFPPRPGDELDWVLVNGVREARSAR